MNIGASSIGTVLFTKVLGGVYGPTVSTIVMTLVVLTFGEITPKSMAKEMPESLALSFAPALSVLVTVFTPLNWIFGQWKNFLAKRFYKGERDTITEGELVTMVSEAEKDGELTDRESELIRSAIEFDDVEVEDVLTPPRGRGGRGGRHPHGRSGGYVRRERVFPPAGLPRDHRQHHRRGA